MQKTFRTKNKINLRHLRLCWLKITQLKNSFFDLNFWKELCLKQNHLELKTIPTYLISSLSFLRQHTLTQYTQLIDIVVSDVPGKKKRFSLNYLLLSQFYNARLILVIKTTEIDPVPSATSLFESANWLEREIWDMFGIFFLGHKDLRRILTDYGFSGHPLRKDFPLTGFKELNYIDYIQNVRYKNVVLAQEYRVFTYENNQQLPINKQKKTNI